MIRLLPLMLLLLLMPPCAVAAPDEFLAQAREAHGSFGERAARFLVQHMPKHDRDTLDADFLFTNLDLAIKARTAFSWAGEVPEEIFLNDVLPYASLDETREPWRPDFMPRAAAIVAGATTATEAAQLLNRDFFDAINVHYHTGRKRPNQSPSESIDLGMATCTGLSIILVDACRSVGIPARVAGTPLWTNLRGNHTWVEIWDQHWRFMGADEYDAGGVDRGWFVTDARQAQADVPRHAIYATSWRSTGIHFPMVWARGNASVPALNVTARYAAPTGTKPELGVRFIDEAGRRIVRSGVLTTESGTAVTTFMTRGDGADRNDLPRLTVRPGATYRLRFNDRETSPFVAGVGATTRDVKAGELGPVPDLSKDLTKALVPRAARAIYEELVAASRPERLQELASMNLTRGDLTLKWLETTFGDAPPGGHSLWISMHGGGGAPARVNDQQWKNQAGLYQPAEGIYLAPRAPTDAWNLWHQEHIDPMFQRLIENFVALRGVNPDKVYLMGYSAGGDGVWQLAPRMADRFAAASMMAGHPNETSLLGLRNLPFALFVGAEDAAYDRNQVVAERAAQLEAMHAEDPGGYRHLSRIYEGLGHWMEMRDAEALPWMAAFTRNPWPPRLVWLQDDITHDRFYWLKLPKGAATKGQRIDAAVRDQTISLDGDVPPSIRIRLSDALLDLDRPISVSVNGAPPITSRVRRNARVLRTTLVERLDPASSACAEIEIR